MGFFKLKQTGNQVQIGQRIGFRVNYNRRGNGKEGGMAINFRRDMKEGSDIILHFNPRHPSYQIILNSFLDGRWQREVITDANEAVFSDEFTFSLDIVDEKTILVRVGGGILTTYTCSVPITEAEYLEFSPEYRITEEHH
ncbi:uncharacterized protein LOC134266344 [Saccostrea cucullata]|uniref:uncharacterized protein LOC134266344 n=1 Tax=Saccostrea cuccullata TaxID=36930 RepID=UPI002ED2E8B6